MSKSSESTVVNRNEREPPPGPAGGERRAVNNVDECPTVKAMRTEFPDLQAGFDFCQDQWASLNESTPPYPWSHTKVQDEWRDLDRECMESGEGKWFDPALHPDVYSTDAPWDGYVPVPLESQRRSNDYRSWMMWSGNPLEVTRMAEGRPEFCINERLASQMREDIRFLDSICRRLHKALELEPPALLPSIPSDARLDYPSKERAFTVIWRVRRRCVRIQGWIAYALLEAGREKAKSSLRPEDWELIEKVMDSQERRRGVVLNLNNFGVPPDQLRLWVENGVPVHFCEDFTLPDQLGLGDPKFPEDAPDLLNYCEGRFSHLTPRVSASMRPWRALLSRAIPTASPRQERTLEWAGKESRGMRTTGRPTHRRESHTYRVRSRSRSRSPVGARRRADHYSPRWPATRRPRSTPRRKSVSPERRSSPDRLGGRENSPTMDTPTGPRHRETYKRRSAEPRRNPQYATAIRNGTESDGAQRLMDGRPPPDSRMSETDENTVPREEIPTNRKSLVERMEIGPLPVERRLLEDRLTETVDSEKGEELSERDAESIFPATRGFQFPLVVRLRLSDLRQELGNLFAPFPFAVPTNGWNAMATAQLPEWPAPYKLYSVSFRTLARWFLWLDENPGLSQDEIRHRSLLRGLSFHTLVREDHASRFYSGLGSSARVPFYLDNRERPPDHNRIPSDGRWYAFLDCVETVLNRPHARAAFLRGGYTWRLALEFASPEALAKALGPPSREALEHRKGRRVTRPNAQGNSETYIDDQLTHTELMLLSCAQDLPLNHGTRSLMPLATDFEMSNAWTGEWTERDERWFRTNIKELEETQRATLNTGDWKRRLRGPTVGRNQPLAREQGLDEWVHEFYEALKTSSPSIF